MAYRENIAAMARSLGLENPLEEEALHIQDLLFHWHDDRGRSQNNLVQGTAMNLGGRCYVEQIAGGFKGARPLSLKWDSMDVSRAADFFADIWRDRAEKDRALLIGLGRAYKIDIIWKDG